MLGKNKKFGASVWRSWRQPRRLILIISILVVTLLAWHWHGGNSATITETNATSGTSILAAPQSTATSTSQGTAPPKNPATGSDTSSTTFDSPYGTYASYHSPKSTTQIEQSICHTSAGASCKIEFTKGDTTKSLPVETVGNDGTASWKWTPRQYDLTSGNWNISAIAIFNGESKSSADLIPLQIP